MSKKAIKKHDRDDDVQRRVREFKNAERWEDWTPCEMYGCEYVEGTCRDCGTPQEHAGYDAEMAWADRQFYGHP